MLRPGPDGEMLWDASGYPAFPVGTGRQCYYDTEGDNLLDKITQFWCIGLVDLDTAEEFYFGVDQEEGSGRTLADGLRFMEECAFLVAHNGYDFDRRALKKIYPAYKGPSNEWDSLIMVKLIWPAEVLIGPDLDRIRKGLMPAQLMKRHSLKAWGYRTGTHKDEYKGGFDAWNPAMASYMMGDNAAGVAIWKLCMKRLGWDNPAPGAFVWPHKVLVTEHAVAAIIIQQTEDGVRFDREKAIKLTATLQTLKVKLEDRLKEIFGSWWQAHSDKEAGEAPARAMSRNLVGFQDVTVRRFGKTGKELAPYVGPPKEHFAPDAPFVRVEHVTFNPSSRQHLGQRLQEVYGWKPKEYGKDGAPKVDETVLSEIAESVMPKDVREDIMSYFVVNKTLGTLSAGKKSWLGLVTDEGRVHGRMDPLGTITGRGAHKDPNLSGTPSVRKEKIIQEDGTKIEVPLLGLPGRFGYECRDLFVADEGWELSGIDMSSLELILLGHYLFPADDGKFSERVCDPKRDAHTEHSEITGTSRADAKTAIYLKIYGGSAYKLSLDPAIIVRPEEVPGLLGYRGLSMLLRSLAKRFGADYREPDDTGKARLVKARQIILAFDEKIEGLKKFQDDVSAIATERGWLKALDGRKLHVRKAYAAPNSLLQGGGAEACKLWMVLLHGALRAAGLLPGRDFKQVLWVHDELQFTHRPGLGPVIKRLANETAIEAGVQLGLRGSFRTEGKTGLSWAECH